MDGKVFTSGPCSYCQINMFVSTLGQISQNGTREFRDILYIYEDYVQRWEGKIFASIDKSPAAHQSTEHLIPKENTVTQSVHLLVFLRPRYLDSAFVLDLPI